jgi:predicted transcriptional regulator
MKWLKSSEVSALLGISVQAVHKAAKEGKYGSVIKYEKGRGYQGRHSGFLYIHSQFTYRING